jgi:predicted permease
VIGVGVLLGYRGVYIGALLAMAASPTAVASFAMAQNMGGDAELAGQAVVVTSAASIVTLFFWVFALSSAGVL